MTDEEHVEQSADPGRTVVYCGGNVIAPRPLVLPVRTYSRVVLFVPVLTVSHASARLVCTLPPEVTFSLTLLLPPQRGDTRPSDADGPGWK